MLATALRKMPTEETRLEKTLALLP